MKKIACLLLTAASCASLPVTAQTDAENKAWAAHMAPGPQHEMMAKCAGDWTGKASFWMKPGGPASTATVDCKYEMILGGRFLQSKNTGDMMGMPFEGVGVTAYDNTMKKFVSTWMDNMGTSIMTLQGTWDEKSKSITFRGKTTDPLFGKEMPVKEVVKFVDDNNQVLQMYSQTKEGKEYKSMEILFARK